MAGKAAKLKRRVNLYPPFLGAGIRIRHIADDLRTIEVEMPLRFWNKNYVGTHFGGSLYSMCDPFLMIMLINNLGPDYIVWDKAATIRFKKPGRSTLYAAFKLDQEEIDQIHNELSHTESIDRVYNIDLTDEKGTTCATVEKVIHIRRKQENQPARDKVSLEKESDSGEST